VPSADPVLHLLAGPNGAGKSTFVTKVLAPAMHLPFVNADLIATRTSFISETVFSHPSKLTLIQQARSAGFQVELHVVLVPEDLSVARVAHRVGTGGHQVPEVKIRERYRRLWPLIVTARGLADRTWIYDNSRAASPLRLIAQYDRGVLVGPADYPSWAPAALLG
jgi:predicted ABC-type ATPase